MTPAFVPESFSEPPVNPATASLFRRSPYISLAEYRTAPTAVSVSGLVPNGAQGEQLAALAAVINRASGWVDELCFHSAPGTLAASPSTEAAWVTPRENGALGLICNFKPILEVDGIAIGSSQQNMQNVGNAAAQGLITIEEPIIWLESGCIPGSFQTVRTVRGKVYVVWVYVNGFPHTSLADTAVEGSTELQLNASAPGGASVYGVYPGTQMSIRDGAETEVIVVSGVNGTTLTLASPLMYTHTVPTPPDSIIVSALPWVVEQACVSLTSALIKRRGARSLTIPKSPSSSSAPKQEEGQSGGQSDIKTAKELLKPLIVPVMRST